MSFVSNASITNTGIQFTRAGKTYDLAVEQSLRECALASINGHNTPIVGDSRHAIGLIVNWCAQKGVKPQTRQCGRATVFTFDTVECLVNDWPIAWTATADTVQMHGDTKSLLDVLKKHITARTLPMTVKLYDGERFVSADTAIRLRCVEDTPDIDVSTFDVMHDVVLGRPRMLPMTRTAAALLSDPHIRIDWTDGMTDGSSDERLTPGNPAPEKSSGAHKYTAIDNIVIRST